MRSRFSFTPIALASVVAVGSLLAFNACAQTPRAHEVHFSIAAQPLGSALNELARQAKLELIAAPNLVAGKTAPVVSGDFTVRQALERLLVGTRLSAEIEGTNVYIRAKAAPSEHTGTLPEVQVSAEADQSPVGPGTGFVAQTSNTGSKTKTSLLETPQTISVTTRAQLDAQQATNLTQAARYIPGVYFGDNTDTRNEYFKARGFTLDQYQDGLKLLTQGAWIENKADPFFLDRIEVLEGPSSGLYGQSSPGGLVNLVSKRPTSTPMGQVQLQTGTYGRAQAGLDLSGPLKEDGTLLYRLTGLARDTGTQVDGMKERREALSAALQWKPNSDTSFTVLASYLNDPKGGFWSSLPYLGTLQPNPALPGGYLARDLNTGQPNFEQFKRKRSSIGYEFEHRFNESAVFRQNLRYSHVASDYSALQAYMFNKGLASLQRDTYMYQGSADTLSVDNQMQLGFRTGGFKHDLLIGVDYQKVDRDDFSRYGAGPNLNVLAPDYAMNIAIPRVNLDRNQVFKQYGLYVQDQIKSDRWTLTLNARQDHASSTSRDQLKSLTTQQTDNKFTGRAGLSYLFDNGAAPYVSYSTSFNPSTGVAFNGNSFKPTTGQQVEAGVKYKPQNSNALLTASAFRLTQQNVLTSDPLHSGFQVQTGEVRVEGIELSAVTTVTNALSLQTSYTYLKPKVTQDNSGLVGNAPSNVPRNTAKLWADYRFGSGALAGVSIGAGVRAIGKSFANSKNTAVIHGYTLFDAALRYDLSYADPRLKGWQMSVNASNLGDKVYVSDCSDINCRWGQGRTVYATLDYRW